MGTRSVFKSECSLSKLFCSGRRKLLLPYFDIMLFGSSYHCYPLMCRFYYGNKNLLCQKASPQALFISNWLLGTTMQFEFHTGLQKQTNYSNCWRKIPHITQSSVRLASILCSNSISSFHTCYGWNGAIYCILITRVSGGLLRSKLSWGK